MEKIDESSHDDDMLEEYDFRGGVRGTYARRFAEGSDMKEFRGPRRVSAARRGTAEERGESMRVHQEQYVYDAGGNKTAILLPIRQYEQLIEDLHDLAVVAERRDEEPISLDELKQRLEGNDIV